MEFLSRPYPKSPGYGAWGPTTSNHNFCEEDYIVTKYIGEFINTLTNMVYVIYGVYGLRRVQPRADGGLWSSLAFPYWALIGVGVLSAWFHATLKYHSQMGDDLSMFLAVGAVLHQVTTFNRPLPYRRRVTALILGTLIPLSIYHCWADEIVLHEIAFAVMIFTTVFKTRVLMKERVNDSVQRGRLAGLSSFGLACGLFGYFLWNIDFHFCSHLTSVKHKIGLPFGILLELHGWWHILTGICSYVGMAIVEYLVTLDDYSTEKAAEGFVWPVKTVLSDLGGEGKGKEE
ncbi:alkaline ceramidase family protein [Delitschia confertaspora ATCC 74209]|uniref:Alkaline ceramidase family protein n=1 Tax=Delitschia confertaspora ATCC 74209 TaxID=1513339 RepID=A0A9P4JFR8_9PLEO|nr:alkaline ceramidase family protein [Delitschia confertaspora ATCC 74209]